MYSLHGLPWRKERRDSGPSPWPVDKRRGASSLGRSIERQRSTIGPVLSFMYRIKEHRFMLKHLSLCLCLLTLAACGSHQDTSTPGPAAATAPASSTARSATAAPQAATTAPAAVPAASASSPASAASAASSAQPANVTATTADSTAQQSSASNVNADAADNAPQQDNSGWVEGKNYFVISPRQPVVKPGKKINVTEVFSYGCPACDHAHIWIDKLKRSLPDDAVMTYLPAAFRPDENWVVYQRAYFAAKALGVAEKSYDAMFDAVFQSGEIGSYNQATGQLLPKSKWPDIHKIATFYTRYGIKPEQFVAVANSFATNMKMKQASDMVKSYGVQGTPTIVVDGHYRFGFSSAGGYQKGIQLAHYLIRKAASDRAASGQ